MTEHLEQFAKNNSEEFFQMACDYEEAMYKREKLDVFIFYHLIDLYVHTNDENLKFNILCELHKIGT